MMISQLKRTKKKKNKKVNIVPKKREPLMQQHGDSSPRHHLAVVQAGKFLEPSFPNWTGRYRPPTKRLKSFLSYFIHFLTIRKIYYEHNLQKSNFAYLKPISTSKNEISKGLCKWNPNSNFCCRTTRKKKVIKMYLTNNKIKQSKTSSCAHLIISALIKKRLNKCQETASKQRPAPHTNNHILISRVKNT